MTTSPQFRQAILHNLERLNSIQIDTFRSGIIYGVSLKDYSKRSYLRNTKQAGMFKHFFLQKVF